MVIILSLCNNAATVFVITALVLVNLVIILSLYNNAAAVLVITAPVLGQFGCYIVSMHNRNQKMKT